MDLTVRSLIVGGVAAAGVSVLFPSSETVPFMGFELSQPVAVGVAVGSASAIGSLTGRYILPMLPQSQGMAETESKLLNPAVTGAATYLVAKSLMGDIPNPLPLIALGAGSEVAGSYLHEMISPMMMGEKGADVGGMPASGF